ncbi:MAG TPA: Rrf2 family transcriptional regulator [Myxococcota bacterium]|jgi:Rrf2 family protein|nr:Rrf2 family transcriptional regulator [Myxococcota bacterium]
MRLSLQVRYAICGVFDLAYNADDGPVQIRVIGERQAIPPRYLEQIFQRLRRAKLVRSKRGPGGGYSLARAPSEISLRDVVEAVEGPLRGGPGRAQRGRAAKASSGAPAAGSGTRQPPAVAGETAFQPGFLWDALAQQFGRVLAGTTVEALCREAAKARVPRAQPEPHMYFI